MQCWPDNSHARLVDGRSSQVSALRRCAPVERLPEIAVGDRRGYWPVLTNKLTVEAQEFGE